jgi:exonuclease III
VGDLNVAHKPIDVTNPEKKTNVHGFTKEEREGFDGFL